MKLYQDLVATQHPAITWNFYHIQAALQAIDSRIKLQIHGHDYMVSNVPSAGLFPSLPWRTGEAMYGHHNTPSKWESETPKGWFFTPQHCLHQHLLERPDEVSS